jgi:SAM-dependent methyltransferase
MNCDPIASAYRWLEYVTFGPALWRCRTTWMERMRSADRVLLLGDGDGRFLQALLRCNPQATMDWVDNSARMLTLAKDRVSDVNRARVQFYCADARTWANLEGPYDLVILHFFLDCFSDSDVAALIARLRSHLAPPATWVISDFQYPHAGWRRWAGAALIAFMYGWFSWTTQIEARGLPDMERILNEQGLRLVKRKDSLGGLLTAQCWISET